MENKWERALKLNFDNYISLKNFANKQMFEQLPRMRLSFAFFFIQQVR